MPKGSQEPPHQADDDAADVIVWGCAAIARVIGRTERQTHHLCAKGYLPVAKTGGRYSGSVRRLRRAVTGESE
jgi:hypothetical protein